jgi:Tfp pilus assembly protein PilW
MIALAIILVVVAGVGVIFWFALRDTARQIEDWHNRD